MQNISNLTIGQLISGVHNHIGYIIIGLSFLLNLEVTIRQVAVNRGYKNAVNICDRVASFISFWIEVLDTLAKKYANKSAVLLLCFGLILFSGCASTGLVCGRLTGNQVTIPYVGGKADGDAVICRATCVGNNCSLPSTTQLANIMEGYMQTQHNQLTIPGAGTITFTPSSK